MCRMSPSVSMRALRDNPEPQAAHGGKYVKLTLFDT